MKLEARTWIGMKAKLRQAMGWPDRQTWTNDERSKVAERFKISVDFERGVFTASDKSSQSART